MRRSGSQLFISSLQFSAEHLQPLTARGGERGRLEEALGGRRVRLDPTGSDMSGYMLLPLFLWQEGERDQAGRLGSGKWAVQSPCCCVRSGSVRMSLDLDNC